MSTTPSSFSNFSEGSQKQPRPSVAVRGLTSAAAAPARRRTLRIAYAKPRFWATVYKKITGTATAK